MRVVIFGTRPPEQIRSNPLRLSRWHLERVPQVASAVKESKFDVTLVLCGMAVGWDTIGKIWAVHNKIAVDEYPAEWRDTRGSYNRRAGLDRNVEMALDADGGIGFWDKKSTGTKHMIGLLERRKLPLLVVEI